MLMPHFFRSAQFRKQLEEKWQRLYRVAYSWCHDTQLAKDLVQESLSRAMKNSQQLKDPARLDGWLFKILVNCWRDCCRAKRDHSPIEDVNLADESTPESIHARDTIVQQVRIGVKKLKSEHREIISLVDLEQLSYKEVAEILDIPVGTVMSRLCRARNQLREELEKFNHKSAAAVVRRIK
jgi:RNA polymerase sigma-70 factor (ECF subfamily)